MNSVTFKGTKSCTPADNTVNYVDQACNSISMTVKVGNSTYIETTQNITGHSLAVGGYEPVKVTIEYASNGVRADGQFSVSFPDVSLYYVTKTGVNEEYVSTFTGTIYRHSSEEISIGDSIAQETKQGWCIVNENEEFNSCTDDNWGFDEESDCLSNVWDGETCEQGTYTTGLNSYETSASNISQNYYLKHDVVNNIVTASYVCFRYTEGVTQKEACLRGVTPSYYGTFDGISGTSGDNPLHDVSNLNPTGNIAIIESTRSYFEGIGGSCNFHDSYSGCHDSDSSFSFSAVSNGNVMVGPISYDYFACWVGYGNSSSCSDFG